MISRVADVMSAPAHCVSGDASLLAVAQVMAAFDVGAVPVCDREGTVRGMVTDRDVILSLARAAGDATSLRALEMRSDSATAEQPLTVSEDALLEEALLLMVEHQVRRLPVVGPDEHAVGVLSLSDVARRILPTVIGRVYLSISSSAARERRAM